MGTIRVNSRRYYETRSRIRISKKLLYIQEIVFLYDRRYEDIASHIYAHMRKRSTDRKRDRNSGDEDGKADPAWEKDVVV